MKKEEIQKPKVYAVANAHLDTVWNWTLEDTVKHHLVNTLKENFDLFSKYPNYKFNFEGACRYALIKEYYPEEYEKLKEYIAEGKWFVTGSSWENGDVIISSPEALMRNILYGNRFFKSEFGKISNDIFLPDCFGFAYTLPSIMNHMGLTAFSSAKLIWNTGNKVPFEVGIWKGIDGSEVIAALDPGQYVTQIHEMWSESENLCEHVKGLPTGKTLKYYGTGDVGGSPTEASAKYISDSTVDKDAKVTIISAYAGQLADELTGEERALLPIYDGELLMTTHGVGSYTSVTPTKRFNRKNELAADFSERANVLASWLGVKKYPKETIENAWKTVIRHEFHDDLTGTSLQRVYKETFTDYITSLNQFVHELATAEENISDCIDTSSPGEGIPVVVFNGITANRKDVVTADITFDKTAPDFIKVYDSKGKEVASQIIEHNGRVLKIAFIAEVLSDGYSTFKVVPSNQPCEVDTGLKASEDCLENSLYKVAIDSDGNIASIFDKINQKEILDSPIRYELLDNSYVGYGAWEILYSDVQEKPRSIVGSSEFKPIIKILENGPARVSIEIVRMNAISTYKQIVSLAADVDYVNVENNINWLEHSSLLKVAFPLAVSNKKATYDAGLGTVDRVNNEKMMYEVPVHQWANLQDSASEYSVTILNDCKYAMDKPADNIMRLTCIHTPQNKFLDGTRQDVQDFGENRFSYAVMGRANDWKEGESAITAARYNQPLVAVQTTSHAGQLLAEYSFIQVSDKSVAVKAVKLAENTDEIIIRVYETFGQTAKGVKIQMADGILSAREVNGFEDHIDDAKVQDGMLIFDIEKYHVKTFALKLAKCQHALSEKNYKNIELDYNTLISSTNRNRGEYGFGTDKATIPSELLSEEIIVGNVPFKIKKDAEVHKGMLANGQTLTIPKDATKLYIVAASTNEDKAFSLNIGGNPLDLNVQSISSYVGGWDQYGSNYYGFIKEDIVAFSASHIHDVSGDKVYGKFCLFKYTIDIQKGTEFIRLPIDNELLIVSATTLVDAEAPSKLVTRIIDKKEKRAIRTLTVNDGTGSGEYVEGNPVSIVYMGNKAGDVTWKSQTGEQYNGYAVELAMLDMDVTLTPHVKEYSENLAFQCNTVASGDMDGNVSICVSDGKNDTYWKYISLKNTWIILDLGSEKTFDTILIKHAGFGGEESILNTSDFKVQVFSNDEWVTVSDIKGNRLSVTTQKFDAVNSRYIRLVIQKPTGNEIDKFTRIYGIEVFNNSNTILPQVNQSDMTPFDLIDCEGEYDVIYKGDTIPGKIIDLGDKSLIKKWYATNMSKACLFAGESENSLELVDTGIKKKFENIQRIIAGSKASHVLLNGDLIDTAKPCELTIVGKSLSMVLNHKWTADNAGTRNNYAVINADGSMFLPKDKSEGHDIFGMATNVKAGPIRLCICIKISEDELAIASDSLELFTFNPVFPGGDVSSAPITVGDYKAGSENEQGYKIIKADFILAGNGEIEGRILSKRSLDMTVSEFAVYEL